MKIRRLVLLGSICLFSVPMVQANDSSPDTDELDRGVALVASQKYSEAIKLFDEVIKADHKIDSVYYALSNRGDAYCMMGLYDKSEKDLDKAIAMVPGKESAYLHRATLYKKTERKDKAIADYSKAISILEAAGTAHASNQFRAGIFLERAEVYKELGKKSLEQIDLKAANSLKKK